MPATTVIKWHGGKAYMVNELLSLMPPHTRYCESHFGGGAFLINKPCKGIAEWANDKNEILQTFWGVMADPSLFEDFHRRVNTGFSEPLWNKAKKRIETVHHCLRRPVVEVAADFFILNRQSRQGLSCDFATPTSRLRRGMNENVSAWLSAVDGLPEIHARLRRVEIRCMDACDFIRELDSPDTLFYCDPPYMHETRSSTGEYGEHEMTIEQHCELLETLASIRGKFMLSGYRNPTYDDASDSHGWGRVDFDRPNQASSKREKERKTECVWMNYGAAR